MGRRFAGQWPTGPQPYVPTVLQLTVEVERREGLAPDLLREWFEAGFRILATGLVVASESRLDRRYLDAMPERGISAAMFISHSEGRGEVRQEYSSTAWGAFLNTLVGLPSFASFEIQKLDPKGMPTFPSVTVSCERVDGDSTWLNMAMVAKPQLPRGEERWDEALTFMREIADKADPSYGGISFLDTVLSSPLESQLHLLPRDTVPGSRRLLRGYGWVTIIAEEVGVRLGGVAGLRSSGAFAEVVGLENGGFWLRATEDVDNYRNQEAELVRNALAAVLPNSGIVD